MVQSGCDVKNVSRELNIPIKNLLRWLEIGA